MNERLPIRQGDIALFPVDVHDVKDMTVVATGKGDGIIVAEGEVTGHHHRIRHDDVVEVKEFPSSKRRLIWVPENATDVLFTHEEHAALTVLPGVYEVRNQVEYEAPRETDPRHVVRTRRTFD